MTESEQGMSAWRRPAFLPGGDEALLLYVVYAGAELAPSLDIDPMRHRTNGLPEGVNLALQQRGDAAFVEGDFAVGASAAAYASAARATHQFVVAGSVVDPPDLAYLRDTLGVIAALCEAGAVAVFDVQTLKLLTADEFARDVFARDEPTRDVHVGFVHADEADAPGLAWFHTRGMRKFGRPDVSIRAVPEALVEHAASLLHALAEAGLRGGRIPEGMAVSHPGWPEGWSCHHGGSFVDPRFSNVHLEIRALPSR